MGAAFKVLGSFPSNEAARRIAVLGDMLELGERSEALHEGLAGPIEAAGIDIIFCCGPHMGALFENCLHEARGLGGNLGRAAGHAARRDPRRRRNHDQGLARAAAWGCSSTQSDKPIRSARRQGRSPRNRSKGSGCSICSGVLSEHAQIFNITYTFRTGGAIMTALMVVFLFGPPLINQLRLHQGKGQPIRSDGPKSHLSKAGTPTMGGLMILLGVGVATILWADLGNRLVWVVLAVTLAYGLIGFYDDYPQGDQALELRLLRPPPSGPGGGGGGDRRPIRS